MKRRGFTLIELLVVIAIIGILATVVLSNFTSGRQKARATNVLSTLRSVQGVAIGCLDAGGVLQTPPTDGGAALTAKICIKGSDPVGEDVWPDIVTKYDWKYATANVAGSDASAQETAVKNSASSLFFSGQAYRNVFEYGASESVGANGAADGNMTVFCTGEQCNKTGF